MIGGTEMIEETFGSVCRRLLTELEKAKYDPKTRTYTFTFTPQFLEKVREVGRKEIGEIDRRMK